MRNFTKILKTYIVGFVLSILLTVFSYVLVTIHINSHHELISHILLIGGILCIALMQLLVQLIFFLHLGNEKRPYWNVVFFAGTFIAVLGVIIASIWIMNHLNYNMTPAQVNKYIDDQSSF